MNEHDRLALTRDTIRGRRPVDLELPNLHERSLAAADSVLKERLRLPRDLALSARMRADRLVTIIQSQASPTQSPCADG